MLFLWSMYIILIVHPMLFEFRDVHVQQFVHNDYTMNTRRNDVTRNNCSFNTFRITTGIN